ncbi:hypothetical protein [Candidatus Vesicomyidisocius calyptogenae]|uniref:Uncharacterized protein n=1 Tax=Vesicomyosocius okutanii subsp. Calyptogena okutanii (strain HA) TaxID=412965 RepID=A5CWC4_VESOH|nr:hypothetical protein [Candidatus Vesicomyosocius okutanii]BAF61741.1 conserved hypothetical protein [Candidatus Vesicomyosocius okutanii]
MNNTIKVVAGWLVLLLVLYVFLSSLPYTFTSYAIESLYIFFTFGAWMSYFLGGMISELFVQYSSYVINSSKLFTFLIVLSPIIFWYLRKDLHFISGLMVLVMMYSVLFYLFILLNWIVKWNQNGQIQTDSGLVNVVFSILVLGVVMFLLNKRA